MSPVASGNKRRFKMRVEDGNVLTDGEGKILYRTRVGPGPVHRILTEPAYKGETLLWRFHGDGTTVKHRCARGTSGFASTAPRPRW